jgi:hypothetical protein
MNDCIDRDKVTPIFIFSLPRSGSTLLQRVLMKHPNIASAAEPWLLLPLIYSTRESGVVAEYSHASACSANNNFIKNLPNGDADYKDELRGFITSLYRKKCKESERYFLDKTPRYYLIIPEIAELFPNAKFIFLFRNLVQVFSSMLETWGNSGFNTLYENYIDLKVGPKLLSEGYGLLKERSYKMKYEELVQNPDICLKGVCKYLDISKVRSMITDFATQETNGKFWGPTGRKEYLSISNESLSHWRLTFDTWVKKFILIRYLRSIDNDVYRVQGYSKESIISDAVQIKISKFGILDFIQWAKSMLIIKLKLNLYIANSMRWTKGRFMN